MGNPTILLGSLTWAIRAQKLLEQRGIRSNIKKISGSRGQGGQGGCGYGLELFGNLGLALNHLQAANIHIVEVLS